MVLDVCLFPTSRAPAVNLEEALEFSSFIRARSAGKCSVDDFVDSLRLRSLSVSRRTVIRAIVCHEWGDVAKQADDSFLGTCQISNVSRRMTFPVVTVRHQCVFAFGCFFFRSSAAFKLRQKCCCPFAVKVHRPACIANSR